MNQEAMTPETQKWLTALQLVEQLSAWRRAAGFDPDEGGDELMISSGESNAALARYKQELADLGMAFHWCDACQEFHLRLLPPGGDGTDAPP